MILAISNHKGGVGKTTTAVNTAAALALKGYKVLVIDADPQRNATYSLTPNEYEEEGKPTIADTLIQGKPLPIYNVKEGLDLVPAGVRLIGNTGHLIQGRGRLKEALKEVAPKYDFVLIDCPPEVGGITYNALAAAEGVIITLTAEALPAEGMRNFEAVVKAAGAEVVGYLITQYCGRYKLSRTLQEILRKRNGEKVFTTTIREAVALKEAPFSRSDIFAYAPKSIGAADYAAFADELVQRLKK